MPNVFQRRHLNALAGILANLGCVTEFQRRSIATEMAYKLRPFNDRMNVDRFIAAATDAGRADRPEYTPAEVPTDPPPASPHHCEYCSGVATHICSGTGRTAYYCDNHAARLDDCCVPIP